MENNFLTENEEPKDGPYLALFKSFDLFEKIVFIVMNLVGGSIIPCLFLAVNPHAEWEQPSFIGSIVLCIVFYLIFKIYHYRRTKNKMSLHFSPSFTWAGKKHNLL